MTKNQRMFKRTKFVFPVRMGILRDENDKTGVEYFHAFSDNISEGGLKIVINKSIPKNAKLDVRFDLIMNDQIYMVNTKAEVRWVKDRSSGLFEYGILFEDLSDEGWEIVSLFMKDYCV